MDPQLLRMLMMGGGPPNVENANVKFYKGELASSEGKIDELHKLKGDYDFLERSHAYIQWFFPNYFPSRFNIGSQELTPTEAAEFRKDEAIATNYLKSYEIFLDFLGLELFDMQTGAVGRKPGGEQRLVDALVYNPHNQLRMRRVLASLAVTGFRRYMLPLVHHLEWEITGKNENVSLDVPAATLNNGRAGRPALAMLAGTDFLPIMLQYVDGNDEMLLEMTRAELAELNEDSTIFQVAYRHEAKPHNTTVAQI